MESHGSIVVPTYYYQDPHQPLTERGAAASRRDQNVAMVSTW